MTCIVTVFNHRKMVSKVIQICIKKLLWHLEIWSCIFNITLLNLLMPSTRLSVFPTVSPLCLCLSTKVTICCNCYQSIKFIYLPRFFPTYDNLVEWHTAVAWSLEQAVGQDDLTGASRWPNSVEDLCFRAELANLIRLVDWQKINRL